MNANLFRAGFFVFFSFILLSYSGINFCRGAKPGSETDKLALLAFKIKVADNPSGALRNWNDSVPFCQWYGVTCGLRHRRVTALNLPSQNLTGTISPHIGNLTFLRIINLQNNHFYGNIPEEMGRLFRLRAIVFNRNMFQGKIPVNLTRCSELRILDLVMNKLEGMIPAELGTLSKLTGLGLAVNKLTGSIPRSLSNLLFLEQLSLSENSLSGSIPVELGRLDRLNMFQISANSFITGSIPSQLFNMTAMDYFGVSGNRLVGEIPPYIGLTLPNIRVLLLGGNRFTGTIPHSISNASKLEQLDFSKNFFTGSIPVNLGRLKNLTLLNFAVNSLGTEGGDDLSFLSSLVNCTQLQVLSLSNNSLHGKLPDSIANLSSQLNYLLMGANRIFGRIPPGIAKFRNLISLGTEENLLAGSIPITVGYLSNLQILSIFGNSFSGEIPSTLGNLTYLSELSLDENLLQGSIPLTLGNCQLLQNLGLSGNNLSGAIPFQVIGLPSLAGWLDFSRNRLTGTIPVDVGNLKNIRILDLSENKLSGEIPSSLAGCVSLATLNLGGNSFQGQIPPLSSLKGLENLDLSRNNFTGKIPNFLGTFLFLRTLNLSYNNLEGEVPKEGIFKNASAISIIGNDQLCGGIPELHLHSCKSGGSRNLWQQLAFRVPVVTASLAICLLLICFLVIVCWRRKGRKALVDSPMGDKYLKISYAELLKATDTFSSANLIGRGGYGFVYKGSLDGEETPVAVKVLDLEQRGASKSFTAECDALRCIRHRNLVKIITSCSSIDNKGNEFKALVYEFMPNGSLEDWLHQSNELENPRPNLNLMQRLSIAIDIANALEYLHHHCHTCIVHCDLKPSNVLLDDDMVAHVGDFGLARLLYENPPHNPTSSSRLKGSIGYISPEYGVSGEVSTYGDVYSFGIVLLEMLTGKRPTDDRFREGLSLHRFVKMSIPDQVAEIVDSTILEEALQVRVRRGISEPTLQGKIHENLVLLLKLGLQCSAELPSERKEIKDVTTELQKIQKMFLELSL